MLIRQLLTTAVSAATIGNLSEKITQQYEKQARIVVEPASWQDNIFFVLPSERYPDQSQKKLPYLEFYQIYDPVGRPDDQITSTIFPFYSTVDKIFQAHYAVDGKAEMAKCYLRGRVDSQNKAYEDIVFIFRNISPKDSKEGLVYPHGNTHGIELICDRPYPSTPGLTLDRPIQPGWQSIHLRRLNPDSRAWLSLPIPEDGDRTYDELVFDQQGWVLRDTITGGNRFKAKDDPDFKLKYVDSGNKEQKLDCRFEGSLDEHTLSATWTFDGQDGYLDPIGNNHGATIHCAQAKGAKNEGKDWGPTHNKGHARTDPKFVLYP